MIALLNRLRARFRLPLGQYITLHLLVGLVIAIVCLWFFYELAEDVFTNEEIVTIDLLLAEELHRGATPDTTTAYLVISLFGSQVVFIFSFLVGLFYIWRRYWLHLGIWVMAIAGGEVLNLLLKLLFARPRPVFTDPLTIERHYSFPSGHAMMSMIAYGLLAYFLLLILRNHIARILVVFSAVLIVLLIGISRIYLGVHYLSDVLSGFLVGGLWIGVCITLMQYVQQRRLRHGKTADIEMPINAGQ